MTKLDLPDLIPNYKAGINYTYSNDEGRNNLANLLISAGSGYCAYCFTRIYVDGKNYGNLEHSIEEKKCREVLLDCVPNISIACTKCNNSFKKRGSKKRSLDDTEESDLLNCLPCPANCIKPCASYKKVKKSFAMKKDCKIILQPLGLVLSKYPLKIQYDVMDQKFIPSENYEYNDEEKKFIEKHIARFNLNDPGYRTWALNNVTEDVINNREIPKVGRYNNLIADLFIEKLMELRMEDAIKSCETVYGISALLMKAKI